MVISKYVKIKIRTSHAKFYKDKGYQFVALGKNKKNNSENQMVEISIKDLSNGSHAKILVECDNCKKQKEIEYRGLNDKENLTWKCAKCIGANPKIIEQRKNTCIEKYGVTNPMGVEEFYIKMRNTGISTNEFEGIKYNGSYELDFLNIMKAKNLLNMIKRGPIIKFPFENKECYYLSDFYFQKLNLIIEIKSEYTFTQFKIKNEAKKKACIEQGYNFIFIIDKNYTEFFTYLI